MQDRYAAMVKEQISPGMRRLGFTGTAGRYELASPSHWLLVGLQKSSGSSPLGVKFTVNVCAISFTDWMRMSARQPRLGARPSAYYLHDPPARSARIGQLMGGDDHWWRLDPATDPAAIAAEVLDAVSTFAVPWLHQHARR